MLAVNNNKHSDDEDNKDNDDRQVCCVTGEADEGRQGLSANDVFILGSDMDCDDPDDSAGSRSFFSQLESGSNPSRYTSTTGTRYYDTSFPLFRR